MNEGGGAMPNTGENLKTAFAGESQASRKYLYFAEKADKEGQSQIARLFRAASDAETVHARNHLKAMGAIGSIAENLETAISGEHYEFTQMYPGMIDQAKVENNNEAFKSFDWANQVERIHHGLYQQALSDLEAGNKKESKPFYVCQNCGNTIEGEAQDKCSVCGFSKEWFKKID
jgi:rubrerythrin